MANFWGLYGMPQQAFNREQFIEYHRVTQPVWTLVMGDVQLARDTKAASLATNVIVRLYMPDGFWYSQKAEDYLKFMDDNHVDDNLWCFVENEAGINPGWHLKLVTANLKRATPRKLVIGNLSVGTPSRKGWRIEDLWHEADPLLRALDNYRDWLVLGLHEYFNCVPTSGFIGGWPDNAGVDPGKPGGRDLVTFANWPGRAEAQTLTKFHCGRFEFLNRACQELGIKPPRIVLTEHGQDDVSDIKQWVERTVGQGIRGFRTLEAWMQKRFGWTLERGYYEMLAYLRQNVYLGTNVEGAILYTYGNNEDPLWLPFNTNGSGLIERIVTNNTPLPVDPVYPPFPADFDRRAVFVHLSAVSVRTYFRKNPSAKSGQVGDINVTGSDGWYISGSGLREDELVQETINGVEGTWLPVRIKGIIGWIFSGFVVVTNAEAATDPVTRPPMPDPDVMYNYFANIRDLSNEALKLIEPYRKAK